MAKARPAGPLRHAILGAFIFSLFAMSPVLLNFSTWKFGPNISGVGSDAYGFLYSMWMGAQPADGVMRTDSRDMLSGFPDGRPMSSGHIQLGSGAAYHLAKSGVTPVFAYNLIILLCFFGAYFFGFLIFQALGVSLSAAHLGAFAIGLNPYQSLQSVDHVDLAMTWPILLNIFLQCRLLLYKDARAFAGIVLLTGVSVFSHPYYLIFLVIINALPSAWFAGQIIRRKIKLRPPKIASIACAGAVGGGAVFYWKSLFWSPQGHGIEGVDRSLRDLYMYSTKVWDFILPPHFSALFGRFTNEFKINQTMQTGSNLVENTLYPGLLVLLFVSLGILWHLTKIKKTVKWIKENPGLTFFLANIVLVPILCSISPTFDIFSFELPTPTILLHKIIPQFRTMSRLGYVAAIGLVIVFILLADQLLKKRWAHIGLGVFMVLDLGYFHQNFYSDTTIVPAVYTHLRDSTPPNSVIFEVPFMWGYLTNYWQSYHHRPNISVFDPSDPIFADLASTTQMDLGRLVNFCRSKKVDYLIIHTANDLQIPATRFDNAPDERWLFFLFGRYSYIIKIADVKEQ